MTRASQAKPRVRSSMCGHPLWRAPPHMAPPWPCSTHFTDHYTSLSLGKDTVGLGAPGGGEPPWCLDPLVRAPSQAPVHGSDWGAWDSGKHTGLPPAPNSQRPRQAQHSLQGVFGSPAPPVPAPSLHLPRAHQVTRFRGSRDLGYGACEGPLRPLGDRPGAPRRACRTGQQRGAGGAGSVLTAVPCEQA